MIAELLQKLRSLTGPAHRDRSRGYESDLQRKFTELCPNLSPSEIQTLRTNFLGRVSASAFQLVPAELLSLFQKLVEGLSPRIICDPWAGIGAVIASVQETISDGKAFAFTRNDSEAAVGKILAPDAQWMLGDPIELLRKLSEPIDLAVGILPFGLKQSRSSNSSIKFRADLGHALMLATLDRLSLNGVGFFVVEPSFFWSSKSVRWELDDLGFGLAAALALPAGTFAPYTQISTHLIVVDRKPTKRFFVAQLSRDEKTNGQIVANFRGSVDTATIELGRFVGSADFKTLGALRLKDSLLKTEKSFGCPPRPLSELALQIDRRYSRDTRDFEQLENAIFIPLVGKSSVETSDADLTLKPHNYAQVAINKTLSDARFVAQFLNTELGREIREAHKTGTTIPNLTTEGLKNLPIFVPDLATQKTLSEIEARILAEHNTLVGLEIELDEFRRELWANPQSAPNVDQHLTALSNRLSGSLTQQAVKSLDQWFETLPFPLASILRAWQATPSNDFKIKYEHLLHFFEATAEFLSVILLSAFKSNEALFASHKAKIRDSFEQMNLSFQRATFGTWKLVVEYLGKQTRLLLSGEKEERALCASIFADPSLALPEALSRKELGPIFSTANKMRNDSGHGGVVGHAEAQLRNEQLLGQLQKLREVMADVWSVTQLIRSLHNRPRRGVFENEVSVLMGSNSEFLIETRSMLTWLDVERLYISNVASGRALPLLPLVQLGPSPQSAKNACYFFNRLEKDGARFISYHFTDKPELTGQFEEATEAINSLIAS